MSLNTGHTEHYEFWSSLGALEPSQPDNELIQGRTFFFFHHSFVILSKNIKGGRPGNNTIPYSVLQIHILVLRRNMSE